MIYLDSAASSAPLDFSAETINRSFPGYINPSASYKSALAMRQYIHEVRKLCADALGAERTQVFFTSGATESNNVLIHGLRPEHKKKNVIVSSPAEHASVYEPLRDKNVRWLPPSQKGYYTWEDIEPHLSSDVYLLILIHVNNETGMTNDIAGIGTRLKKKYPDIHLHTDCTQSFLKKIICAETSGIDSISFSGHKCHAQKGIGGLFIKKTNRLTPLFKGGGQESGIRPGTENTDGITSLAYAVRTLSHTLQKREDHAVMLKSAFTVRLALRSNRCVPLPFDISRQSPYIAHFSITGVPGEVLARRLGDKDICVSNAAACADNAQKKIRVLEGHGLTKNYIYGSIRVSFSFNNTKEEVLTAADVIAGTADELG